MNQQAKKAAALADELHKKLYPTNTDADVAGNENTPEALVSLENGEEVVIPVDTPKEPTELELSASKFKVLQGKYNAEVPRLHKETRELADQVRNLQAQLETSQTPAPVAKDLEAADLDIEAYAEYGEEFKTLAETVKSLTTRVETLDTENTSLKESITNVEVIQTNTDSEKFWVSLEAAVPDWEVINSNPDFVQWLQEVDPVSNLPRQTHLNDASETLNSNKTISIFKLFNDSVAKESNNNNQRNTNIARQAQPDSIDTPAPVSQTKRLYTQKEIKEFYKDVSTGKWKGHEQELAQIEADIFAAPQEGRIID